MGEAKRRRSLDPNYGKQTPFEEAIGGELPPEMGDLEARFRDCLVPPGESKARPEFILVKPKLGNILKSFEGNATEATWCDHPDECLRFTTFLAAYEVYKNLVNVRDSRLEVCVLFDRGKKYAAIPMFPPPEELETPAG